MTRMLRAVLLGVLSLSVVGCKSDKEPAQSQAGVAAGKVIEVEGTVTVRHGDVARALAKGDTVEGDDTIETGADGHVLIELVHNGAMWELNANKKSKVRESLAWSEPRREHGAKAVEQDTAAAGRPAERNAAETTASAAEAEAPAAPMAPGAPPAAVTAAPEPELAQDKGAAPSAGKIAPKASRRDVAPPPPPPPPPTEASPREVAPSAAAPTGGANDERARAVEDAKRAGLLIEGGSGGYAGGGTGGKLDPDGSLGAAGGSGARTLIRTKRDDIAKCVAGQQLRLTVRVVIEADGTASTTLSSNGKITPAIEACVKKVVNAIEFPAKADSVAITVGG
jgi:hypothetical protein